MPYPPCWLYLVTQLAVLTADTQANCIFDSVKPLTATTAHVSYAGVPDDVARVRRDASLEDLFRPIRLRAYFGEMSWLSGEQSQRLRRVIDETLDIASRLFSGT